MSTKIKTIKVKDLEVGHIIRGKTYFSKKNFVDELWTVTKITPDKINPYIFIVWYRISADASRATYLNPGKDVDVLEFKDRRYTEN